MFSHLLNVGLIWYSFVWYFKVPGSYLFRGRVIISVEDIRRVYGDGEGEGGGGGEESWVIVSW